jgi:hypothetical protein
MMKNCCVAFIRDRLREPRLARSRRAVEQHPLGRFDAKPDEQFGVAQRQFDHLAQLVDRLAKPAQIVVSNVGAARVLRLLIFGKQLDFGILVDRDDALRACRHDEQAHFCQRIGRRVEHLAKLRRHIARRQALLSGGRDGIARHQRAAEEAALQGVCRSLQPQIFLRGRKHHACRGARLGAAQLNHIAGTCASIGALQAVEPDDLQPLILGIGRDDARRRVALAADLDNVALGHPELGHRRTRDTGETATAFLCARAGDLQLDAFLFYRGVGQVVSPAKRSECGR